MNRLVAVVAALALAACGSSPGGGSGGGSGGGTAGGSGGGSGGGSAGGSGGGSAGGHAGGSGGGSAGGSAGGSGGGSAGGSAGGSGGGSAGGSAGGSGGGSAGGSGGGSVGGGGGSGGGSAGGSGGGSPLSGAGGGGGLQIPVGTSPWSIAFSADGTKAYVLNAGDSTIAAYAVGANGHFTAISNGSTGVCGTSTSAGDQGNCVATGDMSDVVTVAGNFAFAISSASNDSHNLYLFALDSSTGAISVNGTLASMNVDTGYGSVVFAAPSSTRYAYILDPVVSNPAIEEFSVGSSGVPAPLATGHTGICSSSNDQGNCIATNGLETAGIAASPNGKWLYLLSSGYSQINEYSINSSTGLLAPINTGTTGVCSGPPDQGNCIFAGGLPLSIAITPDSKYLYVVNASDGTISEYSINQSTGALSALSTGTSGVCDLNVGPGTDPGNCIYTGNLDPQYVGNGPGAMVLSSDGKFAYVEISGSNGNGPAAIAEFSIGSNGLLAPINTGVSNLCYSHFQDSGYAPAASNCIIGGGNISGLFAAPGKAFLYATDDFTNTVNAFSINASTGVLSNAQ